MPRVSGERIELLTMRLEQGRANAVPSAGDLRDLLADLAEARAEARRYRSALSRLAGVRSETGKRQMRQMARDALASQHS